MYFLTINNSQRVGQNCPTLWLLFVFDKVSPAMERGDADVVFS